MKNKTILLIGAVFAVIPFISAAQSCYGSSKTCEAIRDLGTKKEKSLPTPLFMDTTSDDVEDTWGAARSNGNTHEGTDILADRGVYIITPVDGVVIRKDISGLGGKHIFLQIAGDDVLYFAHLDDWAGGLDEGDVLEEGDLVGYNGNTGATYAPYHLHFTIYHDWDAENAFPRMEGQDWSLRDKMRFLDRIIEDAEHDDRDEDDEAEYAYERYSDQIIEAIEDDIRVNDRLEEIYENGGVSEKDEEDEEEEEPESDTDEAKGFDLFEENMSAGTDTDEDEIKRLQRFMRDVEDADVSITGEFDSDTLEAVKDFQEKYKKEILDIWGLDEATGYLGITTRLKMNFLIQSENNSCPIFTEYNSLEENEEGDDVKETQRLLRDLDFYDGRISGEFDEETHEAMIEFQERFDATMLKPWGLTKGTGYKYKTTNKFMNYLRGCDTGAVYLEGRGEFDF